MRQKLRGIADMKSPPKCKIHSIPRPEGPSFLDVYILSQKKVRLEQELISIHRRKRQIDKALERIKKQMLDAGASQELLEDVPEHKEVPREQEPETPFKTKPIQY